jgi:G:T-mismatch repair DNA endonuclease (very short patch repair protein)
LTALGWKARVFWECELQNLHSIEHSLRRFLR